MTNTKNNTSQPDLLSPPSGTKPIASTFATCAQLLAAFPFLADHVDETFLRNRARETNPRTNAPWIPKPRSNQYEIATTILGLLEWFLTRRAAGPMALPDYFDSMQALENSPLGIPKEFTRWTLKNGCGAAQLGGSRINPRPVRDKANEILRLIPTGKITGIAGMESINTNTELGLKLREERKKLEDEALLRRGEMLLSKDATFAIEALVADEIIWEKRDQPLRAALIAAPKTINRQHRTILKTEHVAEPIIHRLGEITLATINAVLAKVRAKIPKPAAEPE